MMTKFISAFRRTVFFIFRPFRQHCRVHARYSVSSESATESFSAQNVLCISEINITTDEVRALGNQLISNGVPVRNGEAIREDGLNFMGEH